MSKTKPPKIPKLNKRVTLPITMAGGGVMKIWLKFLNFPLNDEQVQLLFDEGVDSGKELPPISWLYKRDLSARSFVLPQQDRAYIRELILTLCGKKNLAGTVEMLRKAQLDLFRVCQAVTWQKLKERGQELSIAEPVFARKLKWANSCFERFVEPAHIYYDFTSNQVILDAEESFLTTIYVSLSFFLWSQTQPVYIRRDRWSGCWFTTNRSDQRFQPTTHRRLYNDKGAPYNENGLIFP